MDIKYILERPGDDELTLNDIIELMNHEIGVDDVIIRDFITEICEAEPDKDAIIFDGNYSRHIGLTVRMKVEPNLLRTNTAIFLCSLLN